MHFVVTLGVLLACASGASPSSAETGSHGNNVASFAAGHTSFTVSSSTNRAVALSVFYPVDPDTIDANTPPAVYQLDPWASTDGAPAGFPSTTSRDWEPLGVGAAYEGAQPSGDGRFPLLVLTPAYTGDHWQYIFLGVSLASQGFVVAVTDHQNEGQWPWSDLNDYMVTLYLRSQDLPFVITELLQMNENKSSLLNGTIDPRNIVMLGHSLGGNAALVLTAGYDDMCDELWASNFYGDPNPEPSFICNQVAPDPRIRGIVTMDGASMNMRFANLARVSVPSLLLGETVANSATIPVGATTWLFRTHAAIDRHDSFRAEVIGSNHYSFTNYCEAGPLLQKLGVLTILANNGWLPSGDLLGWHSVFPCYGPTYGAPYPSRPYPSAEFDPVDIDAGTAHQIVTKYTLAFLNVPLRGTRTSVSRKVLTPAYTSNDAQVYFYYNEECNAALPDSTYYTYFVTPGQCQIAQKDPPLFFAP
jgi:predicted dienelactone hydrolase